MKNRRKQRQSRTHALAWMLLFALLAAGFAAWATVSRMTYDAEFVRELNISRQVRVLLFNKRGKAMIAAYSMTTEPANLQLPLNIPEAVITEVCGKRSSLPLKDGILTLTLGEAPVYIEGGELEAFNADRFSAVFEPETPVTGAGSPVTIKITLPEELAKGDTLLKVPAGEFGTPQVTGSGRNWQVTVRPDARLKPGSYDLFFRLESDGRSRYIWQKPLEIVPPMTLAEIGSSDTGGVPAITFRTVGNDGKTTDAVVEILENGKRTLAIAPIRAGQKCTIPLYLTRSGRPVSYLARFTLQDGTSWTQKLPEGIVPVLIPRLENALEKPLDAWPESGRTDAGGGTAPDAAGRGDDRADQSRTRQRSDRKTRTDHRTPARTGLPPYRLSIPGVDTNRERRSRRLCKRVESGSGKIPPGRNRFCLPQPCD